METTTRAARKASRRRNTPQPGDDPRRLIPLAEAAEMLGVTVWTLRRQIYRRELRAIRLTSGASSPVYLTLADIDAWLARCAERETPLDVRAVARLRADCADAEAMVS